MTYRIASAVLAALIMVTAALPERVTADEHDPKVTADQLQARLMAFADTRTSASPTSFDSTKEPRYVAKRR